MCEDLEGKAGGHGGRSGGRYDVQFYLESQGKRNGPGRLGDCSDRFTSIALMKDS